MKLIDGQTEVSVQALEKSLNGFQRLIDRAKSGDWDAAQDHVDEDFLLHRLVESIAKGEMNSIDGREACKKALVLLNSKRSKWYE